MLEFFAGVGIGAGLFWPLIAVIAFVIMGVYASEYDNVLAGIISMVLGLGVLEFIGGYPIWATLVANPLMIFVYALIFLALGAAYAGVWRFRNRVLDGREIIISRYRNYLESKSKPIEDTPQAYEDFLESSYYPFSASKNKSLLANWTLLWPFALGWELSHKPFIAIYNKIYYWLGDMYDHISKSAARSMYKK